MEFGNCTREDCVDLNERTPCTILTGFLGSGKTTLINHILHNKAGYKIAIIENEFGEIGIDDAILSRQDNTLLETEEEVFEMNNGCICCTVRGDLLRIFNKLSKRDTKFDYIIIETTGLADPAPVAQTFFVDEEVKQYYELDAIITMIDCKHVIQHINEIKLEGIENECIEQIAFADKIILNKLDLISNDEKINVINKIRTINSFANIIETTNAIISIDQILGIKAFDLSKILQVEEDFLNVNEEHIHDESVTSVGIEFDGELDLYKLNNWLSKLLRENGINIFRSKGVLNIKNAGNTRYIFQGVHMLMGISSSDDGIGRPWYDNEIRMNRLIFIGRNLNRNTLTNNFKACIA